MTFATKVQSLTGAHSGTYGPAINWATNQIFENSSVYLSRYGIISGLEEAFNTLASLGSSATYPNGIAPDGTLILNGPGASFVGGIQTVDPVTLLRISAGVYTPVTYGGGDYVGVQVGSDTYCIDCGPGGAIGGVHKFIMCLGTTLVYLDDFPLGNESAFLCAAQLGSNTVYLATGPRAPTDSPQQVNVQAYLCGVSPAKLSTWTYNPTDIDAAWTQIYFGGFCLDRTDNNLLAFFTGQSGATNFNYLVKIDTATGAILWKHHVLNAGAFQAGGFGPMKNSSITHGQYGYVCTAGTPTITLVDTSNGSTISTQTTGLNGFGMVAAFGCYNDSLGCIVGIMDSTYIDADSPTLLNSTPSHFSGYGVLYVAPVISPVISQGYSYTKIRSLITGPPP